MEGGEFPGTDQFGYNFPVHAVNPSLRRIRIPFARAQEVLENLEAGSLDPMGLPRLARSRRRQTRETPQPTRFDPPPEEPQ